MNRGQILMSERYAGTVLVRTESYVEVLYDCPDTTPQRYETDQFTNETLPPLGARVQIESVMRVRPRQRPRPFRPASAILYMRAEGRVEHYHPVAIAVVYEVNGSLVEHRYEPHQFDGGVMPPEGTLVETTITIRYADTPASSNTVS